MANFEIQHLRRSRAQCAQELEESTGLVNRLQVRRQIQEADAIFNMNRLGQLEANRRAAREQAVEAEYERRATMFHLRLILALLVAVMLAYGCWCVYMSPELKYIMKRREEVLRS
ncbi:hypothetical protein DOTSEDRAFT_71043 [Dothistroma septosporum NZE10]|uniref:Uncharacterized protein n=1 Tax=Dothistroma septosporum (strain NZE10 / CBS 128990) TaxID=675120 RepID=N1PQG4_DOTSN|nr:hypothetical protein DOTSEDRAFT_71043 [Dothistroma septosporum NZE10]